MARTRSYRRRKRGGGFTKPFSRNYKPSTLRGGARRKQRQRRLKKRGAKLRPGLKFNASGQIVRDRNRTRVANRKAKAGNRSRRRTGRRARPTVTGGTRRRRRR